MFLMCIYVNRIFYFVDTKKKRICYLNSLLEESIFKKYVNMF